MGHREGVCVSFLTGGPFIGHKEGVGSVGVGVYQVGRECSLID